jgi:hypothetical protein
MLRNLRIVLASSSEESLAWTRRCGTSGLAEERARDLQRALVRRRKQPARMTMWFFSVNVRSSPDGEETIEK